MVQVLFAEYFECISRIVPYHGKHSHTMELYKTMEIGFSFPGPFRRGREKALGTRLCTGLSHLLSMHTCRELSYMSVIKQSINVINPMTKWKWIPKMHMYKKKSLHIIMFSPWNRVLVRVAILAGYSIFSEVDVNSEVNNCLDLVYTKPMECQRQKMKIIWSRLGWKGDYSRAWTLSCKPVDSAGHRELE